MIAATIWLVSAILGFQQFGLPTVVFGLALAYSGAALYAWRVMEDRISHGLPAIAQTLHVKLTVLVLVLDGIAYLAAVNTISAEHHPELVSVLADIFTAVALLTISVGLILPGMITYSATEVSKAAKRLTTGTLQQFTRAMAALGHGDLDAAYASVNIVPVKPNSRDELGEMAETFNVLQEEVRKAAISLGEAREKMQVARAELLARHEEIAFLAHHDALTNLGESSGAQPAARARPRPGKGYRRWLRRPQRRSRGYASLSSLQSFPFDKIKIDRTFVSGVDHSGQSEAIVRAVIGLGKALNIPVIAEGVETEAERLFLMREGCNEIQGYLVGHPRPIENYADLTSGAVRQRAMAG